MLSQPVAPEGTAKPGGLITVLALAGVVVAVMQTLLVPVLAKLPELLQTSSSNAAWVMTSTLVTGAVATPVLGRLGDMYGKRRMLLVAMALLVAGSVVCGLTSDLVTMVTGRALQGGAMGAIPLGISIMRDELPPERLGSAMGLMSSSLGIGGALALPAAAVVAEHTDWHTLFFGSAGLGVVSIALVLLVVPESAVRAPGRFDFPGAIGLSAGLVCLLLPISKGGDWGWGSGLTLGMLGAAVVIFLAWGALELRINEPLIDLRTTARRQVLLTNLASIMVGFSFFAMQLVPAQLLQLPTATGYGLGQSMVAAGLAVAPVGLLMMLVSPLGARLTAARGPKASLMAGLGVLTVAYAAGLGLLGAVWQVSVIAALVGLGVGLAYAAMPALIIAAVPASETGAANGLNTLMRSIGTSSSSAVVGMVLAHMSIRFGTAEVPTMAGFRTALVLSGAAGIVGLLIAVFIPGRRRAPAVEPVPVAPESGIGGRVLDDRGLPVAQANFTLIDQQGHQVSRAISRPDGRYTVDVPRPGTYVLICASAHHQPQAATLTIGNAPTDFDVVLTGEPAATGSLQGIVRSPTGNPVADARVLLRDATGNAVASGATGADGRYRFTGLPDGAYTVVASGFPPVTTTVSLLGLGRHDLDLALRHDTGSPIG
ncbi:MFS transporter [Amycolatopsis anabasis]|uniref:MFS transporter n=1 Tax=Amycolatopsis anabasis TaxID=1840409 RepID=UPI001FE940A1|nr:MFS transporter [Amycolatopsis anabasis]